MEKIKTIYTTPTTLIVHIKSERFIADSNPQVSVDREAPQVAGSSLDTKSQGSYNVWEDNWEK